MEIVFLFSSFIAIVLCNTIEAYAYIIKGYVLKGSARKSIGLASWIQYCARILYVFVLLFLSALFEFYGYTLQILNLILYSMMASVLSVGLVLFSSYYRTIIRLMLYPLVKLSYPDLVNEKFDIGQCKLQINNRVFFISFSCSFLLGCALITPFFIAINHPEYRMMATYFGQFLNFFATALTFSYIEPKLFYELDGSMIEDKNLSAIGGNILYSKFVSLVFVCLFVFMLML